MIMHRYSKNKLDRNQHGFASIVVALVLITVLALLTVGFAQLSRREQQNALSRQLASQAQYAAESGINDVIKGIRAGTITATTSGVNGDACMPDDTPGLTQPQLDSGAGVEYKCVIVNMRPQSLPYGSVSDGSDRTAVFSSVDASGGPSTLTELTVSWGAPPDATGEEYPLTTSTGLLTKDAWTSSKYIGLIKLTVVPMLDNVTRDSLKNSAFTAYLYPSRDGAILNYNPGLRAPIVGGNCNPSGGSNACNVKIQFPGFYLGPAPTKYLIHFESIYATSNINFTGQLLGGGQAHFEGAQAVIDVTGKAQDVLKRLQVRVPLNNFSASDALEGLGICKRLETTPGGTTYKKADGSGDATATDDPCNLSS